MRLLAVLLLAGCSSTLNLTVQSNPPGATIYADGRTFPAGGTLTYDERATALLDRGQCVKLTPITAVWVSGARTSHVTEVCPRHPRNLVLTIPRPDVPGREADYNYALQLQQTGIMRRQAANQEFDAGLRMGQSIFPKTTNCTTTQVGTGFQTSCW